MKVMITGAAGFLGRRLTQALIARGMLTGPDGTDQPITRLILADLTEPPLPEAERIEVIRHTGDLSEPAIRDALCAEPYDALFHLASQLTLHAEQDPDGAWDVNVAPLRALIAATQGRPRIVFASSIAVFGGHLPTEVTDDIAPLPETTYGIHKAVNELLLLDASRHGRIDGRALRLPIVLIRPGVTQPVVSDRVAAIAREPLEGRDMEAPLTPEAEVPVISAGAVIDGLIALHDAPARLLPPKRALNLPALTVTVAEMVAAASRAGATGKVSFAPDEQMQRVVNSWPRHFASHYAKGLGIGPDASFDAIIQDYLTHREGSA